MDIKYVAGFFDGEGSIGIYKSSNKNGYSLRTQLTQNKSDSSVMILESLSNCYGGTVGEQLSLSGKIKLNWQASGKQAYKFLHDLEPHLILKSDQALVALEWYELRPPLQRDEKGRMMKRESFLLDEEAAERLKALKQ